MKDFYQILGIAQDASAQEIKKAYRTLALTEHPDKGGSGERMGLLSDAYQTLSDVNKRRDFDEDWSVFQDVDVDTVYDGVVHEQLNAGDTLPHSHPFRKQHDTLVAKYEQSPLIPAEPKPLEAYQSGMYSFTADEGTETQTLHDVFTLIRKKTAQEINAQQLEKESFEPSVIVQQPQNSLKTTGVFHKAKDFFGSYFGSQPIMEPFKPVEPQKKKPQEESKTDSLPLNPALAIKRFMQFLSGYYVGHELTTLNEYLADEIKNIKKSKQPAPNLPLYEGIFELTLMAEQPTTPNTLISSVNKLTTFAQTAHPEVLSYLIPVFYDPLFRNLYAQALHLYWQEKPELDLLKPYGGLEEAKDLLMVLKERLTNDRNNKHLSPLIRHVKLLYQFEKDAHRASTQTQTAATHREEAFHFLDWMPVFINQGSRAILVNLFLQIGLRFQEASRLEESPAWRMADEQLALKMYLTAAGIGNHSTPDVELYANTHVLHYLSSFTFQEPTLDDIILSLKKRTTLLADIFPFFEPHQSNIAFLRQENKSLQLMRQVLHTLVRAHEYNKTHSDTQPTHHAPTTILYQAYEACLKNWYQEEYNPILEQQFRLELMEELLFENDWTFLDVEQRLDSPWVMVDRDQDGWMNPTRVLPYKNNEGVQYKTINGAEINHKTGKINFFMTPWTSERPVYEKLFTLFDLEELLEKNIGGGWFSLDPVDPLKPYHPFNAMRFAPSSLAESELLNTMLLTDYVLKFMTTNQEVQGHYPFEQRPVLGMLKHVPGYLRRIIEDFQASKRTGDLHRFWIETEAINLSLSDETIEPKGISRIHLGSLKMVVKKHRMERDIHGELKDVGDEDEGWPIYVLTPEQFQELKEGTRRINTHAMIFTHGTIRCSYWENHREIHKHVPLDYNETLIELYIHPRGTDGKLRHTTESMPLLYRVVKDMAAQTGLSHRYSPEFIFAHEFTEHYDEFAQYLPEFGRLKELSKMTVLIRYLNNVRQSNHEALAALDYLMTDVNLSPPPDTDSYKEYHRVHQAQCKQVTDTFEDLRHEVSAPVKVSQWENQLEGIRGQIKHLSKDRQCDQVNAFFCQQLNNAGITTHHHRLVNPFVYSNNNRPLAEALRICSLKETAEDIRGRFRESSLQDIELALENNGDAAMQRIAVAKSRSYLQEDRLVKAKLEAGFVGIKLGTQDKKVDLKGQCFWVPASVRHEVRQDEKTGLSRYSFFVYGGVNVQPKINVINGVNGALKGNVVGGGSFNRTEIIKGYQSHHIINQASKNHDLLTAAGFNIHSRANRIYLPTNESQHPTRSIHSGRHTNEARITVENEMTKIYKRGQAQGWGSSQYREAVRVMTSEFRQELRAGNIALNSKHRPWTK